MGEAQTFWISHRASLSTKYIHIMTHFSTDFNASRHYFWHL